MFTGKELPNHSPIEKFKSKLIALQCEMHVWQAGWFGWVGLDRFTGTQKTKKKFRVIYESLARVALDTKAGFWTSGDFQKFWGFLEKKNGILGDF